MNCVFKRLQPLHYCSRRREPFISIYSIVFSNNSNICENNINPDDFEGASAEPDPVQDPNIGINSNGFLPMVMTQPGAIGGSNNGLLTIGLANAAVHENAPTSVVANNIGSPAAAGDVSIVDEAPLPFAEPEASGPPVPLPEPEGRFQSVYHRYKEEGLKGIH